MGALYERVAESVGEVAIPAKPTAKAGEYAFPEDPTRLSADEIGKWMFTLTAWDGYILRSLALSDLAAAEARSEYEVSLHTALARVVNGAKKTQKQLTVEAFSLDSNLLEMKKEVDALEAEVGVWERFHKIYEVQVAALSREISRRMSEEYREGRVERLP